MPRTPTTELQYLPVAAEEQEFKAAKEYWGQLKGTKFEFKGLPLEIENPFEPILLRLVIPKIKVTKVNGLLTLFFEDVTGAAQIIQETVIGGGAATATVGGFIIERRYMPGKEATIEPELSGQRKFSIQGEVAAETVTIPANTAKCVAYWQVLGLGR